MNEFKIENYQDVPIIPIVGGSKCNICGRDIDEVGSVRLRKGKWYCNDCYSKRWIDKSVAIERVKVSILCPFCGTDVGDDFMAGKNKCPCGAKYTEDYDNTVEFTKRIEE